MKKIRSALFAVLTLTLGFLATNGENKVAGADQSDNIEKGIVDLTPVKNGKYLALDETIEQGESLTLELRAKGFNTSLRYTAFNIEIVIPQDPFEDIANEDIVAPFSIFSSSNPSGKLKVLAQAIPMKDNKRLISITYAPLSFSEFYEGAVIGNNQLLAKITLKVKGDYDGSIGCKIPLKLKSFSFCISGAWYYLFSPFKIQSTSIRINRGITNRIRLNPYGISVKFTATFDENFNVIYNRIPIEDDTITDKKVYLLFDSSTIDYLVQEIENSPSKLRFIKTVTSDTGLISEEIIEPHRWDKVNVGSTTRIELYDARNRLVDTVYCVVRGDVIGDMDHAEENLLAFSQHLSGSRKLKDACFLAADINADFVVDYRDNYLLSAFFEDRYDLRDPDYVEDSFSPDLSSVKMLRGSYGFDQQYYTFEQSKKFEFTDFTVETKRLRAGYIENDYLVLSPRSTKAGEAYMEYKFSKPVVQINIDLTLWSAKENLYSPESSVRIEHGGWYTSPWAETMDLLNDIELSTDRTSPITFSIIFDTPIRYFRIHMTSPKIGSANSGRLCIGDMQIFRVAEHHLTPWFFPATCSIVEKLCKTKFARNQKQSLIWRSSIFVTFFMQ